MIQQIKCGLDDAASVIRVGAGGYGCITVIEHGGQLPVSCRRRPGTSERPQERQTAWGRSGGDISARSLQLVNARRPRLLPPAGRWHAMPRGHAPSKSGHDGRLTAGHGHFGAPMSRVRLEESCAGVVLCRQPATRRFTGKGPPTGRLGRRRRRCFLASPGMTASSTFDVIFVGAGHNALIAASYLVKEGRSVCLLDQHATPGGWVRSEVDPARLRP